MLVGLDQVSAAREAALFASDQDLGGLGMYDDRVARQHPYEREPMSDQIPSPEQQSTAFEEAIAYLDSLSPGELERRIAEQDSAAERWAR